MHTNTWIGVIVVVVLVVIIVVALLSLMTNRNATRNKSTPATTTTALFDYSDSSDYATLTNENNSPDQLVQAACNIYSNNLAGNTDLQQLIQVDNYFQSHATQPEDNYNVVAPYTGCPGVCFGDCKAQGIINNINKLVLNSFF